MARERIHTRHSKAFFKSLTKAALKGLTGHWAEALAELPEVIAAVGLDDPPETRAWVLIRRALARAVIILLQEYSEAQRLEAPDREPELNNSADQEPTVFVLSGAFFDRPENSDIIPKVVPAFTEWLERLGIPGPRSRNISDRLRSYFALAVHNEWRSNPTFYQPIKESLLSPFSAAVERELGWRRYEALLSVQIDEPVFGESFGLRQIYIDPRGYYSAKDISETENKINELKTVQGHTQERLNVISLLPHLIEWARSGDRDISVRVVSGGPGSGKSSLMRMLAYKLANEESLRVVLVPLHKIDMKLDLKAAIGNLVEEEAFLSENPIEAAIAEQKLLLILDGLDELEMQGRGAQEVAQAFVREVIRTTDRINSQTCRLQVLISGRELAVQAIETEFRKSGQVLHILPYHVTNTGNYSDPQELLAEDQRDMWWKNYGILTGEKYSGVPKILKQGEIGEVSAQPLLNYLVALSYRRGGLELGENTNINSVYGDLVRAVYERGWAPHDHPTVRSLSEDTFIRLLEEVAVAVWHGDGRTTTLREIEEHCRQSNVLNLVPALEQGASSGISALLLAFYFRQKGRRTDGDRTFEFTHKSFGEYLTALRIIRQGVQISQKLRQAKDDPDSGWDFDEALYRWLAIAGPTVMDTYLAAFLRRQMVLQVQQAIILQESLADLYRAVLTRGWPMHRFPALRFKEQQRWATNAEVALFAVINSCARATKRRTKFQWPSSTSFNEALNRMQDHSGNFSQLGLIQSCLSYLDLDDCVLNSANLVGADLSHSSLRGASLGLATLVLANVSDADCRSAHFVLTNLMGATLTNADFDEAMFADVFFDMSESPLLPSSGSDTEKWASDVQVILTSKGARGTPKIQVLRPFRGVARGRSLGDPL